MAAIAILGVSVGAAALGACTTTADDAPTVDELSDAAHRDGSPVDPAEGGVADGPSTGNAPTCNAYCADVMASCTNNDAQYASTDECLAICALLPLGLTGQSKGDTIACREYYAGSASQTDRSFCASAGPFGGNGACGDRCPIFCELTLSACVGGGEAATPPYASYSDCQTACVGFGYVDGGSDGGGESTTGPTTGDTLNCRLFYLRQAISMGQTGCEDLAVDSPACK